MSAPSSPPNVAPYLYELVGLIKRLEHASENGEKVIRFFQKGTESYEVLGDNAAFICDLVYRTDSSLKKIPVGNGGCDWLTLTTGQLSIALRELVLEGTYYFEFYSQEAGTGWKCTLKASPGNLEPLEHLLYANNEEVNGTSSFGNQAVIGAVLMKHSGEGSILVSLVYVSELSIGICEFADNDLLMHTEAALVQLGIREVLVPDVNAQDEYRRLQELCKTTDVMCTRLKNVEFDAHVGQLDLPRLLKNEFALEASLFGEGVQKCAAAVISYLQLFRHDANVGVFSLGRFASSGFMRLDDSALKSLLLLPTNASEKKSYTLFGLLNQCKTQQGGRLLAQWIRQPLRDASTINGRLDLVEFFVGDSNLRHLVRETLLRGLPDLVRIVRKLIKGSASLQDLAVAYDALGRGVQLADTLRGSEHALVQEMIVKPLDEILRACLPFIKMIYASLDFDAMARHEFLIKSSFDPSLEAVGAEQRKLLLDLEGEARKVASRVSLEFGKKLKMEHNSTYGGYTLRVSRLDIAAVQKIDRLDLAVLKSGLIFVTPEFRVNAQAYEEQGRVYAEKQQVIVREMRQTALTFVPMFEQFNSVVAVLDVLMSLAQAAVTAPTPWTRPRVGSSELVLKNSRHPLVEMRASIEGNLFIPNDAELSKAEIENGFYFGIITGPNMGGKSTFMRQVGMIAVMAHLGSFVPAEEARMPLFDSVMVRVGAGDSLLKGISTFLSEMLQMSAIVKLATSQSLVLVDELGRGTSSEEGTYIAKCLVEHLVTRVGCWGYFATHFHELADLDSKGLGNLHVGLDAQGNGEYRVRPGANKQSLGIELARKLGYPEQVLQVAQLCFDNYQAE